MKNNEICCKLRKGANFGAAKNHDDSFRNSRIKYTEMVELPLNTYIQKLSTGPLLFPM